ncbi:MAG: macrolide transporter ATP-binding/permease protein, partial [Geminicoccaceae bacterium]|nr:macrolide transporter ATP-binding/permease protein [Geminicoccaceae bacterium]
MTVTVLRDAWRSLRSAPGTTAFAAIILTAGIAVATITFSVVDAVILRSLPFEDSERVVVVGPHQPHVRTYSSADFRAWRHRTDAFTALAATTVGPVAHVPSDSGVAYVRAWETSASLFDVLRVRPVVGRAFTAGDEVAGRNQVAVIGYRVWQHNFGGDPGIIGRSIRVGDRKQPEQAASSVEIIGVMPRGFTYPLDIRPQVWIPHVIGGSTSPTSGNYLRVIGRLSEGRTISEAQVQVDAINASVAAAQGMERREDRRPVLVSYYDTLVDDVKGWMLLVLWAVVLVMLVACVNVANLLLARSARRARELAVRASLGATPGQLAVGLIAESLMLSVGAAVLGIMLAWWGVDMAKAALPGGIPRAGDITIDLRVLVVTLAAAIATGLFFGVVPAWQAARVQPGSLLSDGVVTATPGRGRWRATFVVIEVALVSALLVVSTLFVASFVRVVRADLGFERSDVAAIELEGFRGSTTPVLEALADTPGVVSVAELSGTSPLIMAAYGGTQTIVQVRAVDQPDTGLTVASTTYRVSSGYFATAGIHLLRGRTFSDADALAPVAILDELATRVLFADGRDPIGARVSLGPTQPALTVVGVVRTVSPGGPERASGTQLYLPKPPGSGGTSQFIVRTSGQAAVNAAAIQASLARVLPAGGPPPTIRSLEDAFRLITAGRRANAALMFVFGLVVLLIGAAGVYAVMASVVAQQQRELGVRIALGASRGRIARDVLARAGAYLATGLTAGLLAGRALSGLFA